MVSAYFSFSQFCYRYIEGIPLKFKRDFTYPANTGADAGTLTLFSAISMLYFGDKAHIQLTRLRTICSEITELGKV